MYLIPNEEYEELKAAKAELEDLKAMLAVEDEEEDFLAGATCNPDAPEECESCQ